jgi:hypothetical protein
MRVLGQFLLAGIVAGVTPGVQAPPAPADAAAKVLAAAREALGGDGRLSSVRNFVATGRTRQVRGDNLVPIEFELQCELPDKYVRKDEIPAQESGPTSTGFNGDDLIQLPVPPPPAGRAGAPGPPPAQIEAMRKGRLAATKQDFVRLTLGLFASSFSAYPVTFTYAGEAEAPQGKADVIDVKGAGGFAAKLFINSQTHLPVMVSWMGQSMPMRGMPPGAGGAPPGGRAAAPPAGSAPAAPPVGIAPGAPTPSAPGAAAAGARAAGPGGPSAAPVEYRLYYGDYREVDGMQWPFRIRKATGPDTTEETTFDRFRINTKIDQKKFEVRK